MSTSGYRLQFGDETTGTTTAGGYAGCLPWDATADAVKAELETVVTIDEVLVTRAAVSRGFEYAVTFVGERVRGHVPLLQVVDVGTNGCADAESFSNSYTFASEVVSSAAYTQNSAVPMWKMQTTPGLPFDASAADVEGALESLSQCCSVEVSREPYRNGFASYFTFAANDAGGVTAEIGRASCRERV